MLLYNLYSARICAFIFSTYSVQRNIIYIRYTIYIEVHIHTKLTVLLHLFSGFITYLEVPKYNSITIFVLTI